MERQRRWVRHLGRAARLLLLLSLPAAGAAQGRTTLAGVVRDSARRPLAGVEIHVRGGPLLARSNDSGAFRISALPPGATMVQLRRLGFSPESANVILRPGRIDSLNVIMETSVAALADVLIEAEYTARSQRLLPGFWRRRSNGFGSFLTRDEIENSRAHRFTDLMRQVPSATVTNSNGRAAIRFRQVIGMRDCPPQYIVDGVPIEQGSPEEFTPGDVEALELYAGPATIPAEFAPRPFTHTCGAIVIWTRLPGS